MILLQNVANTVPRNGWTSSTITDFCRIMLLIQFVLFPISFRHVPWRMRCAEKIPYHTDVARDIVFNLPCRATQDHQQIFSACQKLYNVSKRNRLIFKPQFLISKDSEFHEHVRPAHHSNFQLNPPCSVSDIQGLWGFRASANWPYMQKNIQWNQQMKKRLLSLSQWCLNHNIKFAHRFVRHNLLFIIIFLLLTLHFILNLRAYNSKLILRFYFILSSWIELLIRRKFGALLRIWTQFFVWIS